MSYCLGDIRLGEHDAKREVIKLKNFEEYFYDHNEISEKIMDPTIFTVLGKKGTGKTLLAELIKRNSQKNNNWFCKSESYKKFSLNELQNLKNGNISTEEYIPIWKWIILIELSKLCIKNSKLMFERSYDKLESFLKENNLNVDLESYKTVDITKEQNVNFGWKQIIGCTTKINTKISKISYIDLIEPLENLLLNLLKGKDSQYTILFDDLDDKFDGSQNYANSIVCLLKTAEELNFKFLENSINFKIIIFLRKDILKMLEYSDLNKIIEGSSIILDWEKKEEENSPLLKLITKKIKKSVPDLSECSHEEVLSKLFRGPAVLINKKRKERVSHSRYILNKTLLRPRDVVNFFNKIIQKYPKESYITTQMIYEVEKNYSDYLKKEISDELVGHLEKREVNAFFLLLKNIAKSEFDFEYLKNYYNEHKKTYGELDLDKIIAKFYLVGALGTKRPREKMKGFQFSWGYREEESSINLDEIICLHNGLKKILNYT